MSREHTILVHCHVGARGAIAGAKLAELGFTNVFNLGGGMAAWEKAGHHLVHPQLPPPAASDPKRPDAPR